MNMQEKLDEALETYLNTVPEQAKAQARDAFLEGVQATIMLFRTWGGEG